MLISMGAAGSETATTPAKLIADPTFETIGVELLYTGDANLNATAKMQYRKAGSEAWINGHPFVRISDKPWFKDGKGAKNLRFATSVLFLKENTDYEVKGIVEDADGVTAQLDPVQVHTKNSQVKTGGGKEYYVDAKAESGGDGSKGKPFSSLEQALNIGGPGDTVHFLPGVYNLTKSITSQAKGSAKAYLNWKAQPGATLTDADPSVSGVGKLKFTQFKKDVDGQWIYKADLKNVTQMMVRKRIGDPTSGYIFWRYNKSSRGPHRGQSVEHMIQDYPNKNRFGAFVQEADAVYFTLPQGVDPEKADLQIARENRIEILLNGRHVLMEGFTVELSCALRVGRHPAGHYIFRRMKFFSHRYKGSGDTALHLGEHGLLEDSEFTLNSCWDWFKGPRAREGEYLKTVKSRYGDIRRPWFQTKAGVNDSYAVNCCSHSVLRYNTFNGHINPLHTRQRNSVALHRNIDIHNNLVMNTGDDAIEPEGPAVNFRVYENNLKLFHNGLSDAPCYVGPIFVVRNMFNGFIQGAFKCKNGAAGQALYYHNVCYPSFYDIKPDTDRPDGGTACAPDATDGVRWMKTRNNIIIGRNVPMHLNRKRFSPKMIETLDYNYNVLWSVKYAEKKYKTMLPEPKSVWALPKFVDEKGGDLRTLDDQQPGVDVGDIIKGINDEVPQQYQFKGKGPDMALYEVGVALPHYGPRKKN